jgi:acetoin utilization deacetylase AcuC-like enzyme
MPPVLLVTHERFLDHDTGSWHPERPARIPAVLRGVERSGLADAVVRAAPRPATREELVRVHRPELVDALERFCAEGGGQIDPDTPAVPASWEAACLAAGAGLSAVEALDRGEADAAFCAVRPPGHHATPRRPMGFCLLNNAAVSAAALAERGERVLIVDWDAHHGNGTQDAFYDDPRVLFVSMHQYPFYPGTGALTDTGSGPGEGYTVNLPFPERTAGDTYRSAIEDVVVPLAERFRPTWVLVSAGFDSHRADPLTDLGLSAGDYVDLTARVVRLVPPGRRIAFLEGGYDLDALATSAAACVGALAGEELRPEPVTCGETGRSVIAQVRSLHGLARA